jgi:hypothetical protein
MEAMAAIGDVGEYIQDESRKLTNTKRFGSFRFVWVGETPKEQNKKDIWVGETPKAKEQRQRQK